MSTDFDNKVLLLIAENTKLIKENELLRSKYMVLKQQEDTRPNVHRMLQTAKNYIAELEKELEEVDE